MCNDIGVYSNTIQFETEVYPNVFWVPLNTLGKSRYTNEEIKIISKLSPDEKRNKIQTLFEAVQLFQISDFQGTFDSVNHWVDETTLWQIHKTPLDAIISNNGCCATDTNWLSYMLSGKYQSIYSFCYANEDGNGHITNCIKHNDWFYFLDMMMCRNDSQEYLCPENGVLEDLLASEWAGFLYKCKNPVDFCLFHMNCCQRKNRISPFVFYLRESEYVYATGLSLKKDGNTFLVPVSEKPIILYLAEKSSAKMNIIELPDVISSQIHN